MHTGAATDHAARTKTARLSCEWTTMGLVPDGCASFDTPLASSNDHCRGATPCNADGCTGPAAPRRHRAPDSKDRCGCWLSAGSSDVCEMPPARVRSTSRLRPPPQIRHRSWPAKHPLRIDSGHPTPPMGEASTPERGISTTLGPNHLGVALYSSHEKAARGPLDAR